MLYLKLEEVITMTESKRRISANSCSYVGDDGKLHLEVELPGVDKNAIDFRLKEDGFYLTAHKDDIEFVSTGTFCCPMKSDKIDARYNNGLLEIDIPFKEFMEDAVSIPIH